MLDMKLKRFEPVTVQADSFLLNSLQCPAATVGLGKAFHLDFDWLNLTATWSPDNEDEDEDEDTFKERNGPERTCMVNISRGPLSRTPIYHLPWKYFA